MSLPSTLYKFSSASNARRILESQTIWTKSPLDFNDPFEVLPAFDEERKNQHITSRKDFYEMAMGDRSLGDLVEGGGEENMPVEQWVGLADRIHDTFFDAVHRQFRVLCFSRYPHPTLLWSHYADSHKGIALGFDLEKGGFPLGRKPQGIEVKYIEDRSELKLPLDYYTFAALKHLAPKPTSSIQSNGEVDANAVYEKCLVDVLAAKQKSWAYEAETRLLYDLSKVNRDGLSDAKSHDAATFETQAITEVIFGYGCPIAEIKRLIPILKMNYPHVKLKYVDLHPYKYEVTIYNGDPAQILANHSLRQNHSFRNRVKRRH